MKISYAERLIRKIPLLNSYYLKHYCDIRFRLFKLNQRFPILRYPRYVHLLVTYDCNVNCIHCQVDASQRKVDLLTYEQIQAVFQDIRKMGVRHLILTGGEPLLREDIFELIRAANRIGIPFVTVATNGLLVEKYQKELASVKIDRVVTSIDDVEERNDVVRGSPGSFRKAMRALEIFRTLGVRHREINTTVFPENISRMEALAQDVSASAATRWILGLLIPTGRATSLNKTSFTDEEYLHIFDVIKKLPSSVPVELNSHTGYIKNFFQDITSEPFFCRAGTETCAIMPDGQVVPCNITTDITFSRGNVKEKSFRKIWDEGFDDFRSPVFPKICHGCEFLSACRGGCWGYVVLNDKFCFKNFCT